MTKNACKNYLTPLKSCEIYLNVNVVTETLLMQLILLTVCISISTAHSSACGRVRRVCGARHPSILSLHPTKHQTLHISNQGRDKITWADFFFSIDLTTHTPKLLPQTLMSALAFMSVIVCDYFNCEKGSR